jgi:hypothetical protein
VIEGVTDLNVFAASGDPAVALAWEGPMNAGKLVFAQLIEHLPLHTFRRCVARHDDGEH